MRATRSHDEREFTFDERDFRRVCRMIRDRAGIHLHPHKRDMVYSRLARRVRALGMEKFGDYLDHVETDPDAELQGFINALTTNLTSFFRESHHFDALAEHLRTRGRDGVRIWCNAASTGEEPYSLAITACEAFGTMTPPVRILATDIDTNVLHTAARGVYPVERVNTLSLQRRRQFFQRGSGANAGLCRVKPELQAMIEFRPLNLLSEDYGLRGGFDAVFCRNVMIYFDKATQYEVLQRVVPLIAPDGLFFAGHSESFGHAHDLITPCGRTTYRPASGVRA